MSEQHGMDILCDAAGSDLLLSPSLLSSAGPEQPQQKQQGQQQPGRRAKRPRSSAPEGATTTTPASLSSPHTCHICKRVYDRADHLTRHLRSHENARPYQCTRCPKRFNRADLLTRHEATHDRDAGQSKRFIRRTDRAAQACDACASSKAKCDDQKPCGRCRVKKLVCKPSTRSTCHYKTSTEDGSQSENLTMALAVDNNAEPAAIAMNDGMEGPALMPDVLGPHVSLTEPILEDLADFDPMHNFLQDMDFSMSWDMDFDAFAIPELELQGPSTGSSMGTSTAATTRKRSRSTMRDPSHGHCAFKRSPWLWEPQEGDYVQQQKEALHVDEQSISKSPAFGRNLERPNKLEMSVHQRDRIFSIVLAQNKDPLKVPSFPSLNLLNYLLQAHFIQDEYQFDSWIHAASFEPNDTLPELLASIISSGAGFISIPAIWQFGLAMHEVVRLGINDLFEKSNANTRDLKALQAFMLSLEVGMWSGFKRQMEIAESFIQPLLTTSVSLQKNPLISFSELSFSLPASRDLWRARTPEAWRQAHNSKTAMPRSLPLISETIHCIDMLDELEEFIDIELCYSAILHGYWGQIWGHREAVRFYAPSRSGGANRLWLKTQHQELYSDLCAFSTLIYTSTHPLPHSTHLTIVLELFLMILHVSPDELQRFAGKCGEEEARRAATSLEQEWANTSESRRAIWHAGQVIAKARRMPPTSLRGFKATTVYLASLTLWTYGLFCSSLADGREGLDPYLLQPGGQQQQQQQQPRQASASRRGPPPGRGSSSNRVVLLDGEETREARAFLQLGRGVPGLSTSAGGPVQPLSDPGKILPIARGVLRENYPVRSEPLPPLVQSLENLMRDLGSGAAGHASRLPSGVQSRAASRMGSEERA